jgi:GDPmannose 4,6-dehydratase
MCDVAFRRVDLDYRDHVVQDARFFRPAEVDLLVGDATKAGRTLGWEPTMSFTQLMHTMVDADVARLRLARSLPNLVEITTVRH